MSTPDNMVGSMPVRPLMTRTIRLSGPVSVMPVVAITKEGFKHSEIALERFFEQHIFLSKLARPCSDNV